MPDNHNYTKEPTIAQPVDCAESISNVTDTEKGDAPVAPQALPATDWDGPDDPGNPHNWPLWQRVYHATTPGFFGFAV